MKVLYIGCYRDHTGWGQAAIDYILAMDSVGIDVVCRPLKLNQTLGVEGIPQRILQLESKDSSGCNICIQHVLPHYLDYNGRFEKNIALYATETSNFKFSAWPQRINTLDEAWVISNQSKQASLDSGINVPIKVIPHASDIRKFEKRYNPLDADELKDSFVFYFIGDLTVRKNITALLKAFHLEFDINENVEVLIKTSQYGISPDECAEKVRSICTQVKKNLKIYAELENYKEELIITDRLAEEDIYRLHTSCDCFVMPSYGEAWCIPAFDALGFGKTPICTDVGGMSDFLKNGGGSLVPGSQEPVFGMTETFNDICTGHEDWTKIDIRKLQLEMRRIYEMYKSDKESYTELQEVGINAVKKFSYEKVGQIIKDELENAS
jgi:glycosyltransferase involved in cell wall biosynthesis|tara:strand:+ start:10945 stop:12084 length:1140 start_codon:yes stop_codon:yes gene_type:complete